MTIGKTKAQDSPSLECKKTNYMSKPLKQEKANENYFLDMKAEDAEIKRASQQNNYIYRLQLQAKHGNCSAIKKLINFDFKSFDADSKLAQNLMAEAQEMLTKQIDIYTDSCGELSEISQESALEEVEQEYKDKSEIEVAQEYNDLITNMELACP